MDDIVNIRVGSKDLVKGSFVGDVHAVEGGTLASDQLDAVDAFFRGIVKVVDDDNLVASLKQGKDCERSNVAAATTSGLVSFYDLPVVLVMTVASSKWVERR